MIRIEEFYESPFEEIKGKYFTLDRYMDLYAESKNGVFSYFTDWAGFNIPGPVLLEWLLTFRHDLRDKERALLCQVEPVVKAWSQTYLIALEESRKDVLDHEIAHALYFLNPDYKNIQDWLIESIPSDIKAKFYNYLQNAGYDKSVFHDEIQAMISECLEGISKIEDYFKISLTSEERNILDTIRVFMTTNFSNFLLHYNK